MSSVGESVARLRLAKLSMMRFTHSICTAVSGDSCKTGSASSMKGPSVPSAECKQGQWSPATRQFSAL